MSMTIQVVTTTCSIYSSRQNMSHLLKKLSVCPTVPESLPTVSTVLLCERFAKEKMKVGQESNRKH